MILNQISLADFVCDLLLVDEICNILGDSNYRWSTREIWFKIIEKCTEHPEGLTPEGNTILPSFAQFTNVL